ncbi:MAG: Gfo/Idh/MocA family oxidoreductase [Pirellulales bacterium]|nr:Gfo/Idh/MocA family oxidoreductase [Pirellulales bacterium]
MMNRIKIGQIGVGHAHAAGKMAAYRQSPDYEVVGIVEPDEELRSAAQNLPEYRDLPWMTEEQLLNVPDLAAVAVETRVRDLLATAERCVKAGKHVHIDKPAGESLPQYQRILDEAMRQHLAVQLGYMYRYSPAVIFLREALKSGWLGEPFEVETVMSKVIPFERRPQLAEYQGGMMFELGCHIIDLVIGALGEPTKVTPFRQESLPTSDTLRDNMLAVFEYPRAIATVKSTGLEVEGGARRHFTLCGTEGTCQIIQLDEPYVLLALNKNRDKYQRGYQKIAFGDYPRYVGDAADLAKIIRGEKDSDFPYTHELAVQRAVLNACGLPTA